jgi:hypothetical protein
VLQNNPRKHASENMNKRITVYVNFLMMIFSFGIIFCADKVLIITHVHSRPDFIELHDKTFKAFLKDKYEYVVFNDAPNGSMRKQIEQTCQNIGIRCLRVPDHRPDRETPNSRHCDGIKYSLETLGFDHDGIVMMLDADMFLVKPFSAANYLNGYDFIGCAQSRANGSIKVEYAGPFLVFLDMRTLPNKRTISFESGRVEGLPCDTGGHTYYYFKNNKTARVKFYTGLGVKFLLLDIVRLRELGYDENSINLIFESNRTNKMYFEFHGDSNFLHYYAGGSNWPGYSQEILQEKNYLLNHFIDQQINYYKELV